MDKTEGSTSQRDHTKEEACCWHCCQHLYLKKENRCWNTYFWQVLSKRYCVVIPFFYEVCQIVVTQGTWLAISSSMAASASNQRTGRKTSGIFSKNNPILGLGRSWRIIWSRIKTWQESLWVQFIVKLVNDSFADTWIGIEVSICRVMLDECLQPLHLNI